MKTIAENKLRKAMLGNAFFSGINGLLVLFFYPTIANWMNIKSPIVLLVLGFGLLLFSGMIILICRSSKINKRMVKSIIIQDWIWVIGSLFILILQPSQLSSGANWLIVIIALVVITFAILQGIFLKKME